MLAGFRRFWFVKNSKFCVFQVGKNSSIKSLTGIFYNFRFSFGLAFFAATAAQLILLNSVQSQTAVSPTELASSAASLSETERNEIFEQVWQLINEKYYDAKFHGVDWNSMRAHYQPRILKTTEDKDFYRLLDQMVSEPRDSDTNLLTSTTGTAA